MDDAPPATPATPAVTPRSIAVVTVGRSDFGIYRPVLRQIQSHPDLRLLLIVAGMHLSPEFGLTVRQIEAEGFPIAERVEMLLSSDSPEGIAKSMGLGTIGFAQAYARLKPDLLLVLGDRFEMHAAAVAAVPFRIPLAHVHGGELTFGAIDDALRHSITKLANLHFVSTEEYARRVVQLGEDPARVCVSGAPSLDNLQTVRLLTPEQFQQKWGIPPDPNLLLVTFHPTTLEAERAGWQADELVAALETIAAPVVCTLPNADTGGRAIIERIRAFGRNPRVKLVENLDTQGYFSLMASAAAMVGNSSSGLIEAPSFALPVVNVGTRQAGRVRAANVIDTGYDRASVAAAIRKAVSPEFRESLRGMANPYGDGRAAQRIVERLRSVPLDRDLIMKRFHDLPPARQECG